MLNKLTRQQEQLSDVVRDEWVERAFTYKTLNLEELKAHYSWLYSLCGFQAPLIIIVDSPFQVQVAANMLYQSQVQSQVESQVRSQVQSQVWSQVQSQVRSQVQSQVWSQVRSQVESQVWSQVQSQVESQVRSTRDTKVQRELQYFFSGVAQITTSASWAAYADYFQRLGVVYTTKVQKYIDLLKAGSWITVLLNNAVIVCSAPIKVHRRPDGVVHNESGPAYKFKNGECYWVLNGVSVPEWLVTTHADKLDPKQVLDIRNTDQRAEGIRKLGIERLSKYGKVIDSYKKYKNSWFTKSQYELIDMAKVFKTHAHAYFLKMANQSVPGVWHMEGVAPNCNTLDKALRWRFKIEDGENYEIKEIK